MSKLGLMGTGTGGGFAWLSPLVPAGGGVLVGAAVATVVLAVPGKTDDSAAPAVVVPCVRAGACVGGGAELEPEAGAGAAVAVLAALCLGVEAGCEPELAAGAPGAVLFGWVAACAESVPGCWVVAPGEVEACAVADCDWIVALGVEGAGGAGFTALEAAATVPDPVEPVLAEPLALSAGAAVGAAGTVAMVGAGAPVSAISSRFIT
jgi:hypothetical protein